jgi:hypothetical protein
VHVDGAECTSVAVNSGLDRLSCTAPAGSGVAVVTLTVCGQSVNASFTYDPPAITTIHPSTIDALSEEGTLTIFGNDFGLTVQPAPIVYVGDRLCGSVSRFSPSEIQCRTPKSLIGRQWVIVSFAGQNSSQIVYVERMCGEGYTGLPGTPCKPCPNVRTCLCRVVVRSVEVNLVVWHDVQGARCPRFYPQPLPAPGYYPINRDTFAQCVPVEACPGGDISALQNRSFNLAPFYQGSSLSLVRHCSKEFLAIHCWLQSVVVTILQITLDSQHDEFVVFGVVFGAEPGAECVCDGLWVRIHGSNMWAVHQWLLSAGPAVRSVSQRSVHVGCRRRFVHRCGLLSRLFTSFLCDLLIRLLWWCHASDFHSFGGICSQEARQHVSVGHWRGLLANHEHLHELWLQVAR